MASILHRLTVRKDILSALPSLLLDTLITLISDLGGNHRPVISKENGTMIVQAIKPENVSAPVALMALSSKIQEACSQFGHGFIHLSSCLNDKNFLQVTFTNDLMRYQGTNVAGESGFGSRGNNKAVRSLLGVATFPELSSAPEASPVATVEVPEPVVEAQPEPVVEAQPETTPDALAMAREIDDRLAALDAGLSESEVESLAKDFEVQPEPVVEVQPEPVVSRRKGRKGRNR